LNYLRHFAKSWPINVDCDKKDQLVDKLLADQHRHIFMDHVWSASILMLLVLCYVYSII